jgi:hypothetical protein
MDELTEVDHIQAPRMPGILGLAWRGSGAARLLSADDSVATGDRP